MTRFVIDAMTLLELVDSAVSVDPSHQLVAPNRIRSDALDLLLDEVGRGAREEKDALTRHERMTELRMRLLGDRVSRTTAWKIARERGWGTLREAEYLAVARLQADALVTVNADMAAMADGIVDVAPFEALLQAPSHGG